MMDDDWPERKKGAMAVISEAQQKGIVRTHGTSCHTLGALKAAASHPWVEVDLARINPAQAQMDANPATVISTQSKDSANCRLSSTRFWAPARCGIEWTKACNSRCLWIAWTASPSAVKAALRWKICCEKSPRRACGVDATQKQMGETMNQLMKSILCSLAAIAIG